MCILLYWECVTFIRFFTGACNSSSQESLVPRERAKGWAEGAAEVCFLQGEPWSCTGFSVFCKMPQRANDPLSPLFHTWISDVAGIIHLAEPSPPLPCILITVQTSGSASSFFGTFIIINHKTNYEKINICIVSMEQKTQCLPFWDNITSLWQAKHIFTGPSESYFFMWYTMIKFSLQFKFHISILFLSWSISFTRFSKTEELRNWANIT